MQKYFVILLTLVLTFSSCGKSIKNSDADANTEQADENSDQKEESENKDISHADTFADLIQAASYGELEIVKALVSRGANPRAKDYALITAPGWTSLAGNREKQQRFEIVKYLVEHGANVNAKNYSEQTALIVSGYE